MAARLKVFAWSDGFHRFTVAATSRPRALEAWGVAHDLFKGGLAAEVTDGPDHKAALAAPGTVIRTGVAVDPGKVKLVKPKEKDAAAKQARARRAKLRAELETLEEETEREIAALIADRDAVERRIAAVRARSAKTRAQLKATLKEDDGG